MQLTEEQQVTARSWFRTKWREGLQCPACHASNWDVADTVFWLTEISLKQLGAATPVIAATCTNCGCVLTFNAAMAGVVKTWGGR